MLFSKGQDHFKQNALKNIKQAASQVQKNKSVVNNSIPPKVKHPTGTLVPPPEIMEKEDDSWDVLKFEASDEKSQKHTKNDEEKNDFGLLSFKEDEKQDVIPPKPSTLSKPATKLSMGVQKPTLNRPSILQQKVNKTQPIKQENKLEKIPEKIETVENIEKEKNDFEVVKFSLSNKDIEKISVQKQQETEKIVRDTSKAISKPQVRKKTTGNKEDENLIILGKTPLPKPKLQNIQENELEFGLTPQQIENTLSILKSVLDNYA